MSTEINKDNQQEEEDNFDPIQFINERFPDEESLVDLDAVINDLKGEINNLDGEILEGIHEHALLNSQMKEEVANTQRLTQSIVTEIKSIKQKAIESESIVHEMCKDIKLLDTAKLNLTTSINTLRKFSDLMTTLDNLGMSCADRKYKEATNSLKAINDLVAFFEPYKEIPQVKDLLEERSDTMSKVRLQIKDDFNLFFRGLSNLTKDTLKAGCHLVELIGPKFRNDIMMMPAEHMLNPYRDLYQKEENSKIDTIEQRYVWFVRELRDFNQKYADAFPHYWGMMNYLVQTFCSITRVQVLELLTRNSNSNDNDVMTLLASLRKTLQFENKLNLDLRKEFQQYLDESFTDEQKKKDVSLKYRLGSLYKINGSISGCFEMYMLPYVNSEERDLRDSTLGELKNDLNDPVANSLETEGVRILNSSMLMFSKIKHLMKRASSISKGQTMFDIFKVVKRVVAQYMTCISEEFSNNLRYAKKNEQAFILKTCVYINTTDYIKETLGTLSDIIITLVSEPFGSKIDFGPEEELCLSTMNKLVNGIKGLIEITIDSAIGTFMSKIAWERLETAITEASQYVLEINQRLVLVIGFVKGNIGDVYMTKLLNTVCQTTNQKFIAAVLKMKKISNMGIQQLLCDFTEIEHSLQRLGKDEQGQVISRLYVNYVNKTSQKTRAIIKMLGINNAQLLDNLHNFKKSVSTREFEKILTIKGFKKTEINKILSKLDS